MFNLDGGCMCSKDKVPGGIGQIICAGLIHMVRTAEIRRELSLLSTTGPIAIFRGVSGLIVGLAIGVATSTGRGSGCKGLR